MGDTRTNEDVKIDYTELEEFSELSNDSKELILSNSNQLMRLGHTFLNDYERTNPHSVYSLHSIDGTSQEVSLSLNRVNHALSTIVSTVKLWGYIAKHKGLAFNEVEIVIFCLRVISLLATNTELSDEEKVSLSYAALTDAYERLPSRNELVIRSAIAMSDPNYPDLSPRDEQ